MEGSQTPRWVKAKKGSRSRDPGQRAFLMTLHPKTGHQELEPEGGCPALEWPLATVPDRQPFQPCHGETSPPLLSQQLSSFPDSAREPWQPRLRRPRTAKGASGAAFIPRQAMGKDGLWRTKMPGCWAPRSSRPVTLQHFSFPL